MFEVNQEEEKEVRVDRGNVKRFRGGLVFQPHRLLHQSNLGSRVTKEKNRVDRSVAREVALESVLGVRIMRVQE